MARLRIKNLKNTQRRAAFRSIAFLVIVTIVIVSGVIALIYWLNKPEKLSYKITSISTTSKAPESVTAQVSGRRVVIYFISGSGIAYLSPEPILESGPTLSTDGKTITLSMALVGGGDVIPENPKYVNIEKVLTIEQALEPGHYKVVVKVDSFAPGAMPGKEKALESHVLATDFQIK